MPTSVKRVMAVAVVAATHMLAAGPLAGALPAQETPVDVPLPDAARCDWLEHGSPEGEFLTPVIVCNELDEATGVFTATVVADADILPNQTVTWYGKLQNPYVSDLLGSWWVALASTEPRPSSSGELVEVELEHTLQDFVDWSSYYNIGWTGIGMCLHAGEATDPADRAEFCAPSLEVSGLVRADNAD
jgi:hypothetical protein